MEKILIAISAFLVVFLFNLTDSNAQFTIKMPKVDIQKPEIKIDKPKIDKPNVKETTNSGNNGNGNSKKGAKPIYPNQTPTNVPVLLKNTIYIQAKTHDQYWKMKGQSNFSSWVPQIRFSQFYNQEKELNYTVEYFNPDGSAWYSETLDKGFTAADRTILYKSPSPYETGVLNTKSTAAIGVYSFKITNQDTKEVLFQGKFKVNKFSRAYSPSEKNKADFFVEHDWLLPFGTIGFHFSNIEIGGVSPLVSVWLKGMVEANELDARVFYKGQQIASTREDGGVSDYDERMSEYAPAFAQQNIWKRWQFAWNNFLIDNNGGFNRQNFPKAFYLDKNPGDYTVKIFRNGAQIRELNFTVGNDGKIVSPAYTNEIPLPYHTVVLPVKILGTEKWDVTGWKTNAFYGNPLTGFVAQ